MKLDIVPSVYISYYPKKSTQKAIMWVLRQYIRIYAPSVTYTSLDELDAAYQNYIDSKSDSEIAADIVAYPRKLYDLGLSPVTIKNKVSITDRFFADACNFHISGNQKRLRNIGLRQARPISNETTLTSAMIKTLLAHSDIRMRALILVLSSSGMRIGEALQLRTDDFEFGANPVKLKLRAEITKNGLPRTVFITDEAAEAVRVWLGIREDTLALSYARHPELRQSVDPALAFPYGRTNETVRLIRVTQRAGCYSPDSQTGHNAVHFHSFRKWFLTQFKLAGGNTTVAECLAGHSGYLDLSYRRITDDELAEEYKKVLPRLTIDTPDDYFECKIKNADEIAKLQINSAQQQAIINRLLQELENVKRNQGRLSLTSGTVLPSSDIDID